MTYNVKIIRDSMSPDGVRLTTMELTFPRMILAEFNTHRMFSRNSSSSRAIPVEKMLARAKSDPFIPIYWGKNQKGMQADVELSSDEQDEAVTCWLKARDLAVEHAERMLEIGVHKQVTNRLLEPFLWHTVILTSTEWANWEGLRCNKEAQPEIRRIADDAMTLYHESWPDHVNHESWHLPLIDDLDDLRLAGLTLTEIVKVCVGRCARVSYLTHDGKRDPQADIELCERLLVNGHMSPFEHAARPMTQEDADMIVSRSNRAGVMMPLLADPTMTFGGNFRGWVQARKFIAHEDNFMRARHASVPRNLDLLNCALLWCSVE